MSWGQHESCILAISEPKELEASASVHLIRGDTINTSGETFFSRSLFFQRLSDVIVERASREAPHEMLAASGNAES